MAGSSRWSGLLLAALLIAPNKLSQQGLFQSNLSHYPFTALPVNLLAAALVCRRGSHNNPCSDPIPLLGLVTWKIHRLLTPKPEDTLHATFVIFWNLKTAQQLLPQCEEWYQVFSLFRIWLFIKEMVSNTEKKGSDHIFTSSYCISLFQTLSFNFWTATNLWQYSGCFPSLQVSRLMPCHCRHCFWWLYFDYYDYIIMLSS